MKDLSESLAFRFEGEALTLCLCWKLTRGDGVVVGVTDHDQALTVAGTVYAPGSALDAGTFRQSDRLKPGQATALGVLSSEMITSEHLEAGVWDGCRVDIHQVDWQAPDAGQRHVWSGYLSEIGLNDSGQFSADLVSLKTDLERPVGRVLQRRCDAVLGDERCTISAEGRTCDQRFETCRDTFANTENFRGFPHLPGNDFILSGPDAANNDGGQR